MFAHLHHVAATGGVLAPFARVILAVVVKNPQTILVLADLDSFGFTGCNDFCK